MRLRWNLIGRNPCDLVTPPKKKLYEIKPLHIQQIRQLLQSLHGHHSEALIILAIATGMRRGELLGLKWQDIDLERGVLQVRRVLIRIPTRLGGGGFVEAEPKSEKARRSILLPTFVVDALKKHQQAQMVVSQKAGATWKDHGYVFCTSHGTHLNPTHDMVEVLKAHLVKAGLPDIRFHDLRHSQATMLLGMKVHPKVVQEILGHSEIAVTMDIYSHVLPTMQEDAMQRINEVLQR